MSAGNLSESFLERNLPIGRTVHMFGQPIERFSRDELIATIGYAMQSHAKTRETHRNDIATLSALRRGGLT